MLGSEDGIKAGNVRITFHKKNKDRISIIALIIIAVIGTVIRYSKLSHSGFWLDEIGQIGVAMHPISQMPQALSYHLSPPLDYLITHVMLHIGHSESILRVPAMIWTILAIVFIYLIGKKLVNRSTGLLAASLVTLAPVFYHYSLELRMYALFFLLSTIALYLLLNHQRKNNLVLIGLVNILGLYTHYYFIVVVAMESIILLILAKDKVTMIKKQIWLNIISFAALIPWIAIMREQYNHHQGAIHYALKPNMNYWKIILNDAPAYGQPPFVNWYGIILALSFLTFLFARPKKNVVLWVWLLIPTLAFFLISFVKATTTDRNLIFIYSAYFILIAALVTQLVHLAYRCLKRNQFITRKSLRYLKLFGMGSNLLLILILHLLVLWPDARFRMFQDGYYKSSWREISQKIDTYSNQDSYFTTSNHIRSCITFYYDYENFMAYSNPALLGQVMKTYQPTSKKKSIVIESNWEEVIDKTGVLVITSGDYVIPAQYREYLIQKEWPNYSNLKIYQVIDSRKQAS